MRRMILLLALIAAIFSGCGQQAQQLRFPAEVGEWKLEGAPADSLEEAWPDARNHGLKNLTLAKYGGVDAPRVLAHRMATEANAFETMQRWRPESGAVAFQYGIFFIVVRSPALGSASLNQFASQLKGSFAAQ